MMTECVDEQGKKKNEKKMRIVIKNLKLGGERMNKRSDDVRAVFP